MAAIILTVQNVWTLGFHKEKFQLPAPSQCSEINFHASWKKSSITRLRKDIFHLVIMGYVVLGPFSSTLCLSALFVSHYNHVATIDIGRHCSCLIWAHCCPWRRKGIPVHSLLRLFLWLYTWASTIYVSMWFDAGLWGYIKYRRPQKYSICNKSRIWNRYFNTELYSASALKKFRKIGRQIVFTILPVMQWWYGFDSLAL